MADTASAGTAVLIAKSAPQSATLAVELARIIERSLWVVRQSRGRLADDVGRRSAYALFLEWTPVGR